MTTGFDFFQKALIAGYFPFFTAFDTFFDFPIDLELGSEQTERPTRNDIENPTEGYCIRTGEKIPYNLAKPFTNQAYRNWASFRNHSYPENYCHKTGKPSNGKTSMRNPIL